MYSEGVLCSRMHKIFRLTAGFIRLFGDNTLQVLSARLKLNFCVPNKNRRTNQAYHAIAATKKTPPKAVFKMECGNDLSSRQVTLQVLSAR